MMNKSDRFKNIIIVILVTLLVVTSGYIILDKTSILKENSSKESKNVTEKKEDNLEEKRENIRDLTNEEINTLTIAIEKVYNVEFASFYPLENLEVISNQRLLGFGYRYTHKSANVLASDIDNIIAKYFGDRRRVSHEDINCTLENIALYQYDSTSNSYHVNENHPGHGGGDSTILVDSKVLYLSGTVKDEREYTVNMKVLYGGKSGDVMGPNNAYYKSYHDTTPVIGDTDSINDLVINEDTIRSIASSLPITTYQFVKDKNNNYGLKSVTIQ